MSVFTRIGAETQVGSVMPPRPGDKKFCLLVAYLHPVFAFRRCRPVDRVEIPLSSIAFARITCQKISLSAGCPATRSL